MTRRCCVLLALVMAVSVIFVVPASAYAPKHTSQANTLKTLGLFAGGTTGFELDRSATRVEAAVMLIRLMGKEAQAIADYNAGKSAHPFTDVPKWADTYIAYLYTNKLTTGMSPDKYGVSDVNGQQYCTFVLRALGYSEDAGDFTWEDPYTLAKNIYLLSDKQIAEMKQTFLRDQMVLLSYNSLLAKKKGIGEPLVNVLIGQGALTRDRVLSTLDVGLNMALTSAVQPPVDLPVGINADNRAPDFSFTQADGSVKKLSDFKGKPIFLNFWATWCPSCVSERGDIQKAIGEFSGDVEFLIIGVGGESLDIVSGFVKDNGYNFTAAIENDNEASLAYQIAFIPITYVIDKNGVITSVLQGPQTYEGIHAALKNAMK